ncbi:hypothetical protein HD806DRAFT_161726 [Xylariaceae sp. AK1471]|nr:hypothetical protein HD806DRAFT_161726 [Xylariaceae sp. AK1471]
MAFWATKEMFHRVAAQPGSTPKKWDREELIRCRATGTGITTKVNLQGQVHPVLANWIETKPELHKELEQPILLAGKILEAVGLPWVSDFLIDDIFDDRYPGREQAHGFRPTSAYEKSVIPHSIVRHHRAPWATQEKQTKWTGFARDALRKEFPKLVRWQIDEDIFQEKGWNGYTCRHPRGDLPFGELDKYETIEKFDSISLHERSRNLTILVMAEFPARLAELRRQGKAQGEEYLITAFMMTVTILHELGHAIYWKDRRSLTRDLREPFYGADLEMELGDSFVAAIFGGWVPVPVRELARLRKDFSFADGVAWRQALNWDHHRMRPKYRAHYSIPVDYIARLFTEASWSTATPDKLIRPQFLTGNSIALRTVGLHTTLADTHQHATAAIADFRCRGDVWVWNRRPGAWFRIPQYDGGVYPELELPAAAEDVICEPLPREHRDVVTMRDTMPSQSQSSISPRKHLKERELGAGTGVITEECVGLGIMTRTEVQIRGDVSSSPLSSPSPTARAGEGMTMKLNPRKNEYSPRKFALVGSTSSSTTRIPRPVSSGTPVSSRFGLSVSTTPRKRDRAKTLPQPRARVAGGQLQQQQPPLATQAQEKKREKQRVKSTGKAQTPQRVCHEQKEGEDIPRVQLGGSGNNTNNGSQISPGRSEISVDELKKRLSQLIGISLTELEKLFDAPQCGSAGV